jgi:hypothetical protein
MNQLYQNRCQIDLWQQVLGFRVNPGEKFANPFRRDTSPGCYLNWYKDVLLLIDWASDWNHISVVSACMRSKNFTKDQAYAYLLNKTEYTESKAKPVFIKDPVKLEYQAGYFSKADVAYWGQYGIKIEDLEKDGVVRTSKVSINGKEFKTYDPSFAYVYEDRLKLYRPQNKWKWISNTTLDDIPGFKTNKPTLIVEKSYKDYRVSKNLIEKLDLNIEVTHRVSEHPNYGKSVLENGDMIRISVFDNDAAGLAMLRKSELKHPNIQTFFHTQAKDTSSVFLEYGESALQNSILYA